jgi:hypothetical protein
MENSKYVYLISFSESDSQTHYIKIGISVDPKARFTQLQSSSPFNLKKVFQIKLNNAYEVEQDILRKFCGYRIRGEWLMIMNKSSHDDISMFRADKEKFIRVLIKLIKRLGDACE